jgi:homeodomain-containing protein
MTTALPLSNTASVSPSDQIMLSETDRSRLHTCIHTVHTCARVRTRAQVLLKLGEGRRLADVCRAFDVCHDTAVHVRTRFAEGGVDAVFCEKRQMRYHQALTGSQQAHLFAIACSPVPNGHDHWTLRMLGRKAVELGFVEKISPETIRALLKERAEALGAANAPL